MSRLVGFVEVEFVTGGYSIAVPHPHHIENDLSVRPYNINVLTVSWYTSGPADGSSPHNGNNLHLGPAIILEQTAKLRRRRNALLQHLTQGRS